MTQGEYDVALAVGVVAGADHGAGLDVREAERQRLGLERVELRRRDEPGDETSDIIWLTPSGREMTQEDWGAGYAKSLGVFLNGEAISEPDPRGEAIIDAKFLLLFNAHSNPITFTLPEASLAAGWEVVIQTATKPSKKPRGKRSHGRTPGGVTPGPLKVGASALPKSQVEVSARSVTVLRSTD